MNSTTNESVAMMERPHRWDTPFGPDMTDEDVASLFQRPEFAAIQADKFPSHIPLAGIFKNDSRIVRFQAGDIVVREADYGNSAFLVLGGKLRVVLAPGLPQDLLGRQKDSKKNFFEALSQLWKNRRIPEVRDIHRLLNKGLRKGEDAAAAGNVFLQDIPAVLNKHRTAILEEGALFGELAALGRIPRTATVFAETETQLLEIRWQGLREIRKYDEGWRRQIDERYRENAEKAHLRATPLFAGLDGEALDRVVHATLFETYGSFDWNTSYKQLVSMGLSRLGEEPIIARQGDYPDGLLMIRAGFARVSMKLGNGERTLTYLGVGDIFGLEELYGSWKGDSQAQLATTLSAVGYVDLLRVPAHILEQYVFGKIASPLKQRNATNRAISSDAVLEWIVEERFMNGTQAMLIDLDRCTRCDDCVRACSSTHDGNPRFIRHGKTFDHWMVAHACMHCIDPVCMIGCPTGAIHRVTHGGSVVINDDTCIGCGTCANSCPYDNITMVGINSEQGKPILAPADQRPILKATKCDLCAGQIGGPACVRACPHDALKRVDFRDTQIFEESR